VITVEGAAPERGLIAGDTVVPSADHLVTRIRPEDFHGTVAPFLVSADNHTGPLGCGEVKLGSGEEGEEGGEFHSNRGMICEECVFV